MRGERAQRIGPLRDESGEVDVADGGPRRRRHSTAPVPAAGRGRATERDARSQRRAPRAISGSIASLASTRSRLPLERVDRELVVGRQRRDGRSSGARGSNARDRASRPARRRRFVASTGRRRRRLPDQLDVALRGDQRVERVEQDADRGGKPQALSPISRPVEQKGARRLQLLRKRRLLADRRAVGRRRDPDRDRICPRPRACRSRIRGSISLATIRRALASVKTVANSANAI